VLRVDVVWGVASMRIFAANGRILTRFLGPGGLCFFRVVCCMASQTLASYLVLNARGMSVQVSTIDKLTEIMRDVFDDDDIKPSEAMTADDVDGWDSLSHIRLMVSIERQFKIKFTNAEIERLLNVGDLLKAIEAKL
jgi:acyl carrier protein